MPTSTLLAIIFFVFAGVLFAISASINYVAPSDNPHRYRLTSIGLVCLTIALAICHIRT